MCVCACACACVCVRARACVCMRDGDTHKIEPGVTRRHQPSKHTPPNTRPPNIRTTHTCRDVSVNASGKFGGQPVHTNASSGEQHTREKEWAGAAGGGGGGGVQSSTGAAFCVQQSSTGAPSTSSADDSERLDVFPPARPERSGRFVRGALSRNNSDSSLSRNCSSDEEEKPKLDIKVLIVDDEAINTKIVSSALTKKGLQCTLASDGTEVVDLIVTQGQHFDIILIDTMMKVMDGPEAVAAVRQHEWNRQLAHIPVLAVTASILRPDQEMCMRAGYQGVIAKPIAVKSIGTEVLKFLERWKEGPESKLIRSPHDWRSDPFCSHMRNNMVRVPPPPSPRSLFLSVPPPPLSLSLTLSLSLPPSPHILMHMRTTGVLRAHVCSQGGRHAGARKNTSGLGRHH